VYYWRVVFSPGVSERLTASTGFGLVSLEQRRLFFLSFRLNIYSRFFFFSVYYIRTEYFWRIVEAIREFSRTLYISQNYF